MRKKSRAVLRTFSPILAEHVLELLAVARQCCGSRFFNQKMPAVTSGGTRPEELMELAWFLVLRGARSEGAPLVHLLLLQVLQHGALAHE